MDKIMLPPGKPNLAGLNKYLGSFAALDKYQVKLLGVRGYYKDTMGVKGKNDIGVYDDAIFLVTPTEVFSFNANTDPSVLKPKVAVLQEGGPYMYRIGLHNMKKPYKALRQYGNVTVLRDGIPHTDNPNSRFWINIHKGGFGTTSSLGCQTIHPTQWAFFISKVESLLKQYAQTDIPYMLTSNS